MDLALQIASASFRQVQAQPKGHVLAALVYLVFVMVTAIGAVFAFSALPILLSLLEGDAALGAILLGGAVFTGAFVVLTGAMSIALAGYVRSAAREMRGGASVSLGGIASDTMSVALPMIGLSLISGTIVFTGMLLCYLPGIVASFLFWHAGALVAVGRLGPIEALRTSAQGMLAHPGRHLPPVLLYWVGMMVLVYVPIVGPALTCIAYAVYTARTVEALFPEVMERAGLDG